MNKREDENVDKLNGQLYILQKKQGFRFGVDSILLTHYVTSLGRGLDLGSGTGIISLLLSQNSRIHMTSLEIQSELAEMQRRSVEGNEVTNVEVIEGDLMNLRDLFSESCFDFVVTNPPYYRHTIQSPNESKAISRHEVKMNLAGLISEVSYVLKSKGVLFMIYHPGRLDELFSELEKHSLRVKRIRFIHPFSGKEATMVLLKAIKGGGRELRVDPPLFIYDGPEYTDEILKIYEDISIERGI